MNGSRVAVLGGGLAGLSLAYHLARKGFQVFVLEAMDKPGGLLRSSVLEGYVFDTGGSHIIFSRDKGLLEDMIGFIGRENLIQHYRNTFIYYNGKLVKYPFENGIYMLPPMERYIILKDVIETYLKREKGLLEKPRNFLEWLLYVFGKELSRRHLIPYNEKIWKRDLRSISLEWVGGRVPNPPIDDIIKSAVGIPTEGYKHQINFYYPLRGGIEFFIHRLLDELSRLNAHVYTGKSVEKISVEDSRYYIYSGKSVFEANYVFSTIPLDNLIRALNSPPKEIVEAANNLDYNSLIIVGLGISGGKESRNIHWIYFPQRDIIFHRIAFLSNYSPYMAPENSYSIIAEISCRPGDPLFRRSDKSIIDEVIDQLHDLGFINRDHVEVSSLWRWRYAYIVYDHMYRDRLTKIYRYLTEQGIYIHGRFGSWRYLNMDHVWRESIELANSFYEKLYGV